METKRNRRFWNNSTNHGCLLINRSVIVRVSQIVAALGLFCAVGLAGAEDWVELYDSNQNEIKARIVKVKGETVTIERRWDKKVFHLPIERLSEESQELVREWSAQGGKSAAKKNFEIPGNLPKRLYPRSLMEIKDGLAEILKRPGQRGFEKKQVEALNLLNAYRFLSGIYSEVKLDKEKVTEATDAADACQKHGSLSHDIGYSTDKCNLHQGQSSIAASVSGYIEDPGSSNRVARGHRRWCLNSPMEEVGFGESEDKGFFAMWAVDNGGKKAKKFSAYPGEGLYPLSYVHGNSWSCYLSEDAPSSDDLKVEVFRLQSRPVKLFRSTEEIPGEALKVSHVSTYLNAINFEPTGENFIEPGIFYVNIEGGGVKVAYIVDLIDL